MYLFIFKKAYFDFIKVPLQAEVRVCFGEFFFFLFLFFCLVYIQRFTCIKVDQG